MLCIFNQIFSLLSDFNMNFVILSWKYVLITGKMQLICKKKKEKKVMLAFFPLYLF